MTSALSAITSSFTFVNIRHIQAENGFAKGACWGCPKGIVDIRLQTGVHIRACTPNESKCTPMPLSEAKARNAKPKSKPYKLTDGEGLFLLVTPAGGKYWRLKYFFEGREKLLALGVYPEVSLSEARERRLQARRQLAAGKDPGQECGLRGTIARRDGGSKHMSCRGSVIDPLPR